MKKNTNFQKVLPHLIAIACFLVIAIIYFPSTLQGKKINQSDKINWKGGAKEIHDFRKETGIDPLWTNSMFSGMPAYQISARYPTSLPKKINSIIFANSWRPLNFILIGCLSFYLLLLAFSIPYQLSIIGAIAFTFSTYNFLIIEAGHNTKMMVIAWMPLVVAGVIWAFKGRILLGTTLFGVALALNIDANHLQITYYLGIILLIFGIAEFIRAIRAKETERFFKASLCLGLVAIIAIGTNTTRLWTTYEYSKETIRGKSILEKKGEQGTNEDGLDKDYALAWSYGKAETFSILVPNFVGGASGQFLGKNSATVQDLKRKGARIKDGIEAPTYWGAMPFTGGPFYFGAIVCFLFVLGCFVVKGPVKWWLVVATLLAVFLSWGKNFEAFTDLFFNYFPMYNKFRAVSTTLVIAQFTVPLLALLAISEVVKGKIERANLEKYLKFSTAILGSLLLVFIVLGGSLFSFEGLNDARYEQSGFNISLLQQDRISLMRMDAIRSLVLILLSVGLLYGFISKKIKATVLFALLGLLTIGDIWLVNKRYLNSEDFVTNRKFEQVFQQSPADKSILQDPDPHYRVFNVTRSPFNDAITSYNHKSIGGYHGAKLRRYQDVIDQHISQNNQQVLNMLNMKYIIGQGQNKQPVPQKNPDALGNAWFVSEVKYVNNPNEEIGALKDFQAGKTAVVEETFKSYVGNSASGSDSTATITLTAYQPNHLTYDSQANKESLAVFSEVYYDKGWNAYIDGQQVDYIRVNYLLRALKVPAGKHKVEFKFEPASYYTGNKITLAFSILLLGLVIGSSVIGMKEQTKT